jgi:hypothetical protein
MHIFFSIVFKEFFLRIFCFCILLLGTIEKLESVRVENTKISNCRANDLKLRAKRDKKNSRKVNLDKKKRFPSGIEPVSSIGWCRIFVSFSKVSAVL